MGKTRGRSVQDAIPVERIFQNGVIQNKLGGLAVILEVSPVGLGLLDQEGRKALLKAYHQFLLRLPGPIFFHARDVTPDLSTYLEILQEQARQAPTSELHAVGMEIHGAVRALLAAQTVREKRFYLVLSSQGGPVSLSDLFRPRGESSHLAARAEVLLQQAQDLIAHLGSIGLSARFLSPEEALNLLRQTYDPVRPPVVLKQIREIVTAVEEEDDEGNRQEADHPAH